MNAKELMYTNKSAKRVLLVSKDYQVREELEGILTQIQMPNAIKVAVRPQSALTIAKKNQPHLILLDANMDQWMDTLTLLRNINTEVPIILLTSKSSPVEETQLILAGIQRFIAKDTLRFCGQILYRCIHGFSLQKYYQVENKAQQRVHTSIEGLQDIQEFWKESQEIQDPVCQKVVDQISTTLNYLELLQKKLLAREELS